MLVPVTTVRQGSPVGSGQTVLTTATSAGATSITLNQDIAGLEVGGIIAIDVFTDEMELRYITGVSGQTVSVAALTYAHTSGDAVLIHDGGLVPWTWAGAKPDDQAFATENVTAFNRIGLEILGLGANLGSGGIFIPAGDWWVDDELIMQHSHTIVGTSPDRSIIRAHASFPFDNTGSVAVMHGTRSGSGNTNYADGGPLSRYYLRDFMVDGSNLTDSNGILVSMQQPAKWSNVRVSNCLGLYGFCIGGQHSHFTSLQASACETGIRLRAATIMFFDGINIEQTKGTKSMIIQDTTGGTSFHLSFRNLHLEPDEETIGVSCEGGTTGVSFNDFWYTNPETGTGIKFDCATANPGGNCRYVISNYRCNTNSATFNMIDDIQLAYTLDSLTDTDRMIMLLVAHSTVAWQSPTGWVEIP